MKTLCALALAASATATIGGAVASNATAATVTPASCTYSVTGSPGSESYTAHITNTCDKLKTRAIITYENFYGTYLKGYGAWVVSGSSKASTSSNVTDTLVCWGHQYQYYKNDGTIGTGTGWNSSGC